MKSARSYVVLTLGAIAMLFPLVWLVSTALKGPTEDIFGGLTTIFPHHPTAENFVTVWRDYPFGRYLVNSIIVAASTVGLNVLFCALAAYPLARLSFWGRDGILAAIVATLMIPFQLIMIPLYILTVNVGLRNSYLGIIFPGLASAFGIFLLRQAFQGVPKELEEAARMDGCTELGLWWYVMLPAIRPAIVTLAIFVFIGSWSDFLWPLIVLDQPDYYTLPLGVAQLASALDFDWRLVAAASVIAMVPIVVVFLFVQRYIIPSAASSGVKG